MHIFIFSKMHGIREYMLLLSLIEFLTLIMPAGLFVVYSAIKLYNENMVTSEVDRQQIR